VLTAALPTFTASAQIARRTPIPTLANQPIVRRTSIPAPPNPIIITEETINRSFVVSNPAPRRIDNIVVDLQAGQIVISFDFTTRAPGGVDTTTYAITAIFTVEVRNGRIYWTLESATVDGSPASEALIRQINTAMSSSWYNFVRSQIRPGRIREVVITEDEIQIFYVSN
jgi:hypothetical protein